MARLQVYSSAEATFGQYVKLFWVRVPRRRWNGPSSRGQQSPFLARSGRIPSRL
jgi:hypothetical protein